MMQFIINSTTQFIRLCERALPYTVVGLFARFAIAPVFWRSGQTKVEGFQVKEITVLLFEEEFNMPFPVISAHVATYAEHILPVMLVLGLGTRFAALGLIIMTIVIQFIYPSAWWSQHALWSAILLVLLAKGGGALSLDELIKKKYLS